MIRGFHIVSSTKNKLNTQSSTDNGIVSVDECIPAVLWTRYWLDTQGCNIFDNIVFQDNKSAIISENNSKASSRKRTKHMNIIYCFPTDRIKKYELSIEWCPIADTIGYFMTKPGQGAVFTKFWYQLTGINETQDPGPGMLKNIVKI